MMESREAKEVTTNWLTASKRGTVSVQMTADELLSLAVNVANGWSLDDLGLDQTANPDALNKMLAEVYEQILRANRDAVQRDS